MQTVLITGAASGIGRATAQQAADQGWRCVLVDHDGALLQDLAKALPTSALGAHTTQLVDLRDEVQIQDLAHRVPALDALINNAGMSERLHEPLTAKPMAQWQGVLELNLQAPARMVSALSGRLAAGARIVNVASGAGLRAIPWRGLYSPSKAGLIAQTRALAQTRKDWCVNVLCPGFVRTELVDTLIREERLQPANAVAKVPLGRMAEPDEMAQALCFLASQAARGLQGQVLSVDGGSSVYGGSLALPPSPHAPLPANTPVALEVSGDAPDAWAGVGDAAAPAGSYRTCLDLSLLHTAPDAWLSALLTVASRFEQAHPASASLTLLLPPASAQPWPQSVQDAGHEAALRMLLETLACEWGAKALRINAVQLVDGWTAPALTPLLRYVAGARAQYLTGQILQWQHRPL